jgi:hypothetical protein
MSEDVVDKPFGEAGFQDAVDRVVAIERTAPTASPP